MKRIFALLTSIVLAANMLAAPCFAAEPEDPPEQPGATDPQQPEDPEQSENPDKSNLQPYDAFPGDGDVL